MIGITWLVLSLGTAVMVYRLPAIYVADTLILVDSQKIPEKYVSSTVSTELQDRLMTINQQILSSTRLQKIIDDFGLYADLKKNMVQEEIVEKMRGDITVKIEAAGTNNRPGAFRISYQGKAPSTVAQVVNRIANLYIEENLKTRQVQAEGTTEFIVNQLKDAKKTLDDLESRLSQYKLAHNGELPQQQGELGAALARLQTELEVNRDATNRAEQSKVMLSNSLATFEQTASMIKNATAAIGPAPALSSVPNTVPGKVPTESESRLATLENQLAELRVKYGEWHPDVRRVQAEINQLKAAASSLAKAEPAPGQPSAVNEPRPPASARSQADMNAVLTSAQTNQQISSLRSQIELAEKDLEFRKKEQARLLESMNQIQKRLNNLPIREQEMAEVTRDYQISQQNYKSLLDKKISAEMASDMEHRQKSERFTVLDPARVPEKPIRPKRGVLYTMGCGFALAVGLVLGFGLEFRQNVFLGEWELPSGVPVLARIPNIDLISAAPATGLPGSWRRLLILSSAALSLCAIAFGAYYIVSHGL